MSHSSRDQDYKRASIEQRPSFYNNHVSAIVGKLYSEKAYYFESADRSAARGRITGEESTTVAVYATGEREKGTKKSHLGLLPDQADSCSPIKKIQISTECV
jgi:hypothetical protein